MQREETMGHTRGAVVMGCVLVSLWQVLPAAAQKLSIGEVNDAGLTSGPVSPPLALLSEPSWIVGSTSIRFEYCRSPRGPVEPQAALRPGTLGLGRAIG
jgi:hypothetical protein